MRRFFVKDGRIRWTRLRRSSQVSFLLFFLVLPLTYAHGQITVMGTLAALRIGPISLVDPVSGVASILASREVGLTLLGCLLLLEILLPRRLWCRALCPVGSFLVLLRHPKTLTIAWTEATCKPVALGANCFVNCPWNIDPRHMRPRDGCTNCGTCVEGCPTGPSLRFKPGLPPRRLS